MTPRLLHTKGSQGYKTLDGDGVSHSLSPTQRLVLIALAVLTIAATVTVGVYWGLQIPSTSAPSTTAGAARAMVAGGAIVAPVTSLHNKLRRSVK